MKPAVDEMFPEGAGPYVDLDEVRRVLWCRWRGCGATARRRSAAAFSQAGGSTGLLMDLAANEKAVHADFFNDFEDLFDDDDIQ
ncbi:CSN9 protein, partial [Mohoua ochrocephala]|nr:CSN9 protein [Mohoua ochrocephala]